MKKDNTTFNQKAHLRKHVLKMLCEPPVILETHGGNGEIYKRCYSGIESGVVFERDRDKAATLVHQRPTWRVYGSDCITALQSGVAGDMTFNFVDLDPYGSPWDAVEAFFASSRCFATEMYLCVQDGLRQHIRVSGGWKIKSLAGVIERFGSNIHDNYLHCCRFGLTEKAAPAGYTIDRFNGYYCGAAKQMTHYWAKLVRTACNG